MKFDEAMHNMKKGYAVEHPRSDYVFMMGNNGVGTQKLFVYDGADLDELDNIDADDLCRDDWKISDEGMPFQKALELLQDGFCITRMGWSGSYIFLGPNDTILVAAMESSEPKGQDARLNNRDLLANDWTPCCPERSVESE